MNFEEPRNFNVVFLDQAIDFLEKLDSKAREKIIYNIDKSRYVNDPELFKKLEGEVWGFRTSFNTIQYRLFAFWDKSNKIKTVVVVTYGIIKKRNKVPKSEIVRTKKMRLEYFKMLKEENEKKE